MIVCYYWAQKMVLLYEYIRNNFVFNLLDVVSFLIDQLERYRGLQVLLLD